MSETQRRTGVLATFVASAPVPSAIVVAIALAGAGLLFVVLFSVPGVTARQIHNHKALVEWTGAGITAVTAIVAAFRIHVRGRTLPWRAAPLALFAAWQAWSIYTCRDVPLQTPAEQILHSHSPDCFLFIIAISIPIALILFSTLRLHRVQLGSSASAMTGLAVCSVALVLLPFFHDFDMNFGDWSIHFLAMGVVVGSSAYVGQLLPAR